MAEDGPLDYLARHPTTILESAVALLKLRPRSEGFTRPGLVRRFAAPERIVGYAVTSVVSTDLEEKYGRRENFDYWTFVEHTPPPRVAVIEDVSAAPGVGAALGRLGAHALTALGCRAVITNGGVRDIGEIGGLRLQVFSGALTIGHGNPHVVRFGGPVTLMGAVVRNGDVVCADEHGMLTIPAEALPRMREAIAENERRVGPVLAYCRTAGATAAGLAEMVAKHMKSAAVPQQGGAAAGESRR